MSCAIKNPSNIDLSSLQPHVERMYDYFHKKLGFNRPPTMVFDSDPENKSKILGKTAYYDPNSMEVHVFVDGRHPKDMLRSIAHELIHHHQNLEDRLDVGGYMGEGYYLKNEKMKKLENEAMLKGNALMREYEDNYKLEEKDKMSLKEWKNKELGQQVMKKFGLLTEADKPDYLDLDKDGDKEESMKDAAKVTEEDSEEESESEEKMTKVFNNELGNEIEIEVRDSKNDDFLDDEEPYDGVYIRMTGQNSEIGNVVTRMEAKNLLLLLQNYFEESSEEDKKEEQKAKQLQEAMKRIANTKKVKLNGKRIK